jgi:sensor histidine kinase YesM
MRKREEMKMVKFYLWVALGYLFIGILNTGDHPGLFLQVILNNIWAILYVTVLNYILFEYAVPFILRKRKFLIYNLLLGILFFWIQLMLYSYGSYAWRSLGIGVHIYTALKTYPSLSELLQNQMAYSAGSIFFFGVTRHIYNYIKLKNSTQQLQIEKQAAELNYLRAQTNPHFLFNTLNNIYSLARDKSDLAPESILRLSKILRFMLYETSGANISIEQELKIIDDYIALESLRYDDSLKINFSTDVEDMKQSIPPLLLIALVENSFKHGVSETRDHAFVNIHLSVKDRQLTFTVKNSSDAAGKEVKENIGLSNIRRQLELLYKEYDLSVRQDDMEFTAILKINLSSHV